MRNRLDTHPAPKWSVPVTGNDPIHDEIGDAHGEKQGTMRCMRLMNCRNLRKEMHWKQSS